MNCGEEGPNISYFHAFGCECYILNTRDQLGKFDSKVDKGIFLGYSETSKAYRIYNSRTSVVEESIHVKFNERRYRRRTISRRSKTIRRSRSDE